jgi:hypothetical protein
MEAPTGPAMRSYSVSDPDAAERPRPQLGTRVQEWSTDRGQANDFRGRSDRRWGGTIKTGRVRNNTPRP